ncbi:MAG TPA: DUF971 domain-containing protein [Chthoniobacterales bacterium]
MSIAFAVEDIMPIQAEQVELIGDELAIRWNDGQESFLSLERLRRACPCAACGGEPDVLGHVNRPAVTYSPASFRLDGFVPVGGYALGLRWGDGHSTGIYSFVYLRKLSSSGDE